MDNTKKLLNGIEYLYPDNKFISQIKRTLDKFPDCEDNLVDAFSLGQLKSKLWLIDNLPDNLGTVFICAGWYGTLASLMFDRARKKFDKIRSFDIDETCADIADTMNRPWVMDGWQFKASTLDILKMEYPTQHTTYRANGTSLDLIEMPDTIINTSCEHIENFEEWYSKIPKGQLICLQSNDYVALEEHVNCVKDSLHFEQMAPLSKVYFTGELPLEKYTRYMRIGIK
jgi:hypothetical protein